MTNRTSEIEAKWQERWYSERINESERDSRPKFMIIFAYPGVTGYLHVGHMRGFSYVDAFSRFKRMQGFNVLFPVGTHATGNGAVGLATRIRKKDQNMVEYMLRNGCPEDVLETLTEPRKVVEFFNDVYVNQYWKRFGFLSDWRRFTCTIFPDYGKFIQWQFRKLMEQGLLIQKPYFAPACVNCGPVAIDASETDIMCGGGAETTEYTLMKFRVGDMFLVAATLRPETVFGQTNFWVNPDVEYVKVKHAGEIWVVSAPAAEKMKYQMDDVTVIGKIPGAEIVGMNCTTPMTHREIPALPATFCDPNVGTGLVVSVPSDAPDDWMALKTIQEDDEMIAKYALEPSMVKGIKPIAIIETKGWGPMPAIEIIEKLGITQTGDPRLEEAKKTVYKEGFHQGRMNQNCGKFSGMSVVQAKDLMKQEMLSANEGALFYDLSEDVVCRCGQPVLIKKVTDQWFIDYANQKFTDMTKEHCKSMHILPNDYYTNVQPVLDWFRERACVRQGNWLGTKFPFDEKWIIEAISDSTLYPVYYLISKYVNSGEIRAEQMTEAFFDYVILGKGESASVANETGVPSSLLDHIRADVDYWYPLDLNLGGKEHMTVHFPAFLMNHVAILPKEKWPRGIFVNWYVIGKAGKISKSKGGAQPIPGAAEKYGVDSLRLYYAHIASPFADVEWDEEITGELRLPAGPHHEDGHRERWHHRVRGSVGHRPVAPLAHVVPRRQGHRGDGRVRPPGHVQRGLFRDPQRFPLVRPAGRQQRQGGPPGAGHLDQDDDADHPAHGRGTVVGAGQHEPGLLRIIPQTGSGPFRPGGRAGRGLSARGDGRYQQHHQGDEDQPQAHHTLHVPRLEVQGLPDGGGAAQEGRAEDPDPDQGGDGGRGDQAVTGRRRRTTPASWPRS